jgi:hypothetical protein
MVTCLDTNAYNVYIRDGIQAENGGYDQALDSSRDDHAGVQAKGVRNNYCSTTTPIIAQCSSYV